MATQPSNSSAMAAVAGAHPMQSISSSITTAAAAPTYSLANQTANTAQMPYTVQQPPQTTYEAIVVNSVNATQSITVRYQIFFLFFFLPSTDTIETEQSH